MTRLPSTSSQLSVLEAAYNSGVRSFDTAPIYGFGQAETVLGKFLSLHSTDDVEVTTKLGLRVSPAMQYLQPAQRVARALIARSPAARRLGQAVGHRVTEPTRDRALAESAASSLKRLGQSSVANLLAHDVDWGANGPRVLEALSDEREAGRAIRIGVSGSGPTVAPWIRRLSSIDVMQVTAADYESVRSNWHGPICVYGVLSNYLGLTCTSNVDVFGRVREVADWLSRCTSAKPKPSIAAVLVYMFLQSGASTVVFGTTRAENAIELVGLLREISAAGVEVPPTSELQSEE